MVDKDIMVDLLDSCFNTLVESLEVALPKIDINFKEEASCYTNETQAECCISKDIKAVNTFHTEKAMNNVKEADHIVS
jgi:hypothetical protein